MRSEKNKYESVKIIIIVYFLLLIPVSMEAIPFEVAMAILMASQSIPLFKDAYRDYKEKNKRNTITNLLIAIFIIVLSVTYFIF